MIKEIDLIGIFVPPFFGYLAAATVLWFVLHWVLTGLDAYRLVWHPPLVDLALFVLVLAGLMAATFH